MNDESITLDTTTPHRKTVIKQQTEKICRNRYG